MIRNALILLLIMMFFVATGPCLAYWVWTPESGKWENPKYAAKDTPEEQLVYAQGAYKEGNFKLALKEFKKLIKYYPLSKEAPTAQYYIGRIMQDTGKYYDAFKALQKVIDLYPYTELVDDVIEREYNIGELFFSGHKINILGPIKVPAKDKAIEIFKAVADNAPYGKYADMAMYKAGLTYKDIYDYDNAILMFKGLIDKYPNSELIDKARYQLAECSKLLSLNPEYDQTPTEVAREEFEEFIEKHPESEMAKDAKKIVEKLKNREAENAYNIGQFYEARKMPGSAAVYYRDVIQGYPDTVWAGKSRERLNEIEKK
ncbi:MAG: outer membrane protein assembly factor BamD [Candidatus Omnitrophica bacterium]|nr:outer membrane protein assembly factor BamD [Candidatus Omnitrophota bacterium]